ncbi:MAG: DUF3899 domain-containing protein [Oscillospiraceae bacterium]|nr:DUF3899 domain-containing protein [Oscillospiraceae bacterium]
MFKRFRNIRLQVLIPQVVITLAYPIIKAFSVQNNRLLYFTNGLTVIGLILVIIGVLYSMILHGDFDLSAFYLQRGARGIGRLFTRRGSDPAKQEAIVDYLSEAKEKRAEAFNYPLFLGILSLAVSAVLAWGFLS